MSDDFDRVPPSSAEAESAVLGAMLVDATSIPIAIELLVDTMFYRESHRRIYRAMIALWEEASAIDVLTLADRLKKTGELSAAGGVDYLSVLLDVVPHTGHVEYHAKIVRTKARLRRLVEACSISIRDVYDMGERSADEVITAAEERVLDVAADGAGRSYQRTKELFWPVMEEIEERQRNPGGAVGISTGLDKLDRMTLGLHDGEVTVIAARPSMGKTALAMQIATSAAADSEVPTLVFSFEMTSRELMTRILATEAHVDLQALRGGRRLHREEYGRLSTVSARVTAAPLIIDDSPDSSVGSVVGRAMRTAHAEKVGLIVIDYLQLMEGEGRDRQAEITMISRRIKRLAQALSVPVVLLSQLSRGPESRTTKRPILSDLRESGAIEQDADGVWMLFRPEYYMDETAIAKAVAQSKDPRGVAEILVMKQRNGPTGKVKTHFEKRWTRFSDQRPGEAAEAPA